MSGFLDYVPGDSILHRLDPRTKLLLAFLICIACFTCESLLLLAALVLFSLVLGAVGHVFSLALRLFRGLLKFSIFLFLLQLLFIRQGQVLVALPLHLRITDQGLFRAAQVVLRLIGATLPLALMISLTQLSELSGVLVSRCHIPYKYAFAVTSAIRFIPSFTNQMHDIMEAQTARGVDLDTKNFFKKLGLLVPLCVPLLISSVQGIDATAIATELRGFHLRGPDSAYKITRFHLRDVLALLLGAVLVGLGIAF